MLILQRKAGQSLTIGQDVTVTVLSVDGGRVRISIDAPKDIPILRSELLETIEANKASVVDQRSAEELLSLLGGGGPHPGKGDR